MPLCLAIALSACAGDARITSDGSSATPSFLLSPSGARIVAKSERDITNAARQATDPRRVSVAALEDAERVSPAEIPYLALSPEGKGFLALDPPRALARGAPADACPATGLSAPGAEDAEAAVADALARCLGEARAHARDCGCEVVAVDDAVLLAREETGYAVGTTARLLSADMGLDTILVAEENQAGRFALRDLGGEVGRLAIDGAGRARLVLAGREAALEGVARAVGFRRGRRAWRLYLTDPLGRRASVLIGFSPAELAGGAGGWLAFPPDLAG